MSILPVIRRCWPQWLSGVRYAWALACFVAFVSQPVQAQFLSCDLRSLSQAGAQVGTEFSLRATSGSNLEELSSLIFSHPGITGELVTLDPLPFSDERRPDFGNFRVKVASDVPPGRYEVRVVGRGGVSNPRAFIVSSTAFALLESISHSPDAATPLTLNTLTQGRATASELDFFKFAVEKSRAYQIELLAHQIDSRMIGQIVLFDQSGRQVALRRGADETDPTIEFVAETAGEYRLAVHDFTFRGGAEYPYQLIVRSPDSEQAIAADNRDPDHCWLPRSASVAPTDFADISMDSATIAAPQHIDIPTVMTRWFPDDHQDTVLQFAATQDQVLAFDVASHRLGEPTDSRLMVQRIDSSDPDNPKLTTVLNVDDSQAVTDGVVQLVTKDSVGLLKIPTTGDYRLLIRDLDIGRSLRDRQRFQLTVRPAEPRFDLVAYRIFPHKDGGASQPVGSKLFRGGAEIIRVLAIRQDGWSGPIKISVKDLPEGVEATEAIIAANQNHAQIVLTASDDAPACVQSIQVTGSSVDGKQSEIAEVATITWGKGAGRGSVRSRLTKDLMVAVSDKDTAPLTIRLPAEPLEVKKGQELAIPVTLVRREGGKANVVLRARDFPPGASGADLTIAADKSEGSFQLKTGNTAPGTYSLWLQAETKIKVKANPQLLERTQNYRNRLQKLHDDPAQSENLDAIKAAITEADKAIETAKPQAADRELTVYIPTTNATVRVVEP